jgi:hypothetical protein
MIVTSDCSRGITTFQANLAYSSGLALKYRQETAATNKASAVTRGALTNRKAIDLHMRDDKAGVERPEGPNMNRAFILRFIWDGDAESWRIVLKPADGGPPQLFADFETAFLYIARIYVDHE